MAVPAYSLVTLAQAKQRLGVTDSDRDAVLEALIGEVSRLVLQTTGREYAPATASATRTLPLKDGSRIIDLYPYEARTVTGITIAPGTDHEQVLDADDWQLVPVVAPDGVYDQILLAIQWRSASVFGVTPVSVTGSWGWADVPEDVQGWTLEMIEDRWKQDHAFYADADGFITDSSANTGSGGPVTIPFRIRDEMEHAKRTRIGSV